MLDFGIDNVTIYLGIFDLPAFQFRALSDVLGGTINCGARYISILLLVL